MNPYRQVLSDAGLMAVGNYVDEGENHYYESRLEFASGRSKPSAALLPQPAKED